MSIATAESSVNVFGMANPQQKIRVTVDLSPELHERFIAACFHSKPRRSMQEVIREQIERWLSEQRKKK